MSVNFDEVVKLAEQLNQEQPFIRFMPFDPVHVPNFMQDVFVPKMHDRIISGVARRLGAPLITSDPLIGNYRYNYLVTL